MSETWREKVGASLDDLHDIDGLQSWVEAISEEYWSNFWTPKAQIHLDTLRAKALFGGSHQNWADNEALEFFGLQ